MVLGPDSQALAHVPLQYTTPSQEAVRRSHTFTPVYETEIRPSWGSNVLRGRMAQVFQKVEKEKGYRIS